MDYYPIILFLLAIAIAVSTLAPMLNVPYPVLLMLAGMVLGFIPNFYYVPVRPGHFQTIMIQLIQRLLFVFDPRILRHGNPIDILPGLQP